MSRWWVRAYRPILWASLLWAIGNCVYVYVLLDGARVYRIETAVWIMVVLALPFVVLAHGNRPPWVAMDGRQTRTLLAWVGGLWFATFLPLLRFPFLSDDYVFLELYRGAGDLADAPQFFRPAFALVFLVLRQLGGGEPFAFHAAALALHGLAAWLVYGIARRFFDASAPAWVAFTVFLLNPLQLEATLWVSGLQEVLWTVFILAALRIYIGARVLRWPRLLSTTLCVAAALLSKETAVCYAVLLPGADWVFFRLSRGRLLPVAYLAFALLLVTYFGVRREFAEMEAGFLAAPSRFFLKQFVGTPYRMFAQPWSSAAADVPAIVACLVAVAVLAALLSSIVFHTNRGLLAGPAVILISTLPVYSYFFVREDLMAARYLYFASAGWALLVAELLGSIRRPWPFWGATCAVATLLTLALHVNLRPWRAAGDVVTTMERALRNGEHPDAVLARRDQWPAAVQVSDGIPREYLGVGIFINGYAEFVDLARRAVPE